MTKGTPVRNYGLGANGKILNFTGNLRIWLSISGAIFLIGIIVLLVFGVKLDINYSGGAAITYTYTGSLDATQVANEVKTATGRDADVSLSKNYSGSEQYLTISMSTNEALTTDQQQSLASALQKDFTNVDTSKPNIQSVSPSVGQSFFIKGMYAIVLGCVFVTIYVAIRFRKIGGLSAGAMALIALFHDIVVAFFIYVIFRFPIDDQFVAVVLTILGYSLNDTVVIYDRIRENRRRLGSSVPFNELVNVSINQTLGRTIMTALATFVAVMTICIIAFANDINTIISFSVTMSIGIISGSYSTICLSGPLWVKWNEHKEKKAARLNGKPAPKKKAAE